MKGEGNKIEEYFNLFIIVFIDKKTSELKLDELNESIKYVGGLWKKKKKSEKILKIKKVKFKVKLPFWRNGRRGRLKIYSK